MEKGLVSVIIISWNSIATIERCLVSLKEADYRPLEIIVIDNASSDGTVKFIEKNFPQTIIIKNTKNKGFSFANNQGIKISRGEFVLFLNADAYIRHDFLNILTSQMKSNLRIGACGGKVYKNESGKIIDSTGIFFSPFKIGPYDRGEFEEDKGQYEMSRFVPGISCACALYRRECLEDIRMEGEYFDEDYFAYYEDVDLAWRARIRGWRCLHVPEAVAYHKRSGRKIKSTPLFSRAMANLYITYIKNESGIGLISLCLFKIPHETGRIFLRMFFRGKTSYGPRLLESLRLTRKDLREALRKRKIIQSRRRFYV